MNITPIIIDEPQTHFDREHPFNLTYDFGKKKARLGLTYAEAVELSRALSAKIAEFEDNRRAELAHGIRVVEVDGTRYRVQGGRRIARWVEANPALRRCGHWVSI